MFRRPSPALLVAILALIVALAGTAVAAERYVITSTGQIKPSVLKELRDLRATAHASTVEVPRSVIAHDYSLGPVTTGGLYEPVADPLAPVTWTQQATELNGFAGTAELTVGTGCGEGAQVTINVDVPGWTGYTVGSLKKEEVLVGGWGTYSSVPTVGEIIKIDLVGNAGTAWTLFAPGKPTTRTLSASIVNEARAGCHITVDNISIDVTGARPS